MTVHDEALAARIRTALGMDKRVSGLPINMRITNGEVFLKGRADTFEQADTVQFIVSGIPGVHHVDVSELEVKEEGR